MFMNDLLITWLPFHLDVVLVGEDKNKPHRGINLQVDIGPVRFIILDRKRDDHPLRVEPFDGQGQFVTVRNFLYYFEMLGFVDDVMEHLSQQARTVCQNNTLCGHHKRSALFLCS
jgi:hypothetical protein